MFLTFEGIEGAGKSTIMERMAEQLRGQGLPVLKTREPGGTAFGRELRRLLLDIRSADFSARAELLLFLADRAQHLQEVIMPALAEGVLVLCDRYADSTLAYQGYGRGMPLDKLAGFIEFATGGIWPDMTLLFDLPVELGLARAGERHREEGTAISEGRFEAERLEFHQRVRAGYLELAAKHPGRYAVVDASAPTDAVLRQALDLTRKRLAVLRPAG
ncbi:MAG: dTMP kinase [Deltaproteobacteria bacterium]|jgi:dTMP kinase|nr:dTMP kinase [Deltaproteobacteria bacterium]